MRGRDFLITELYDEIWILQQKIEVHVAEKQKQTLHIKDLQEVNIDQRQKITRKNKTILILIGVDVVILAGLILLR